MILSYLPLMEKERVKIEAEITTEHSASSYGIPVIVLKDGGALDYNSAILLNYKIEEISEEEKPLFEKWQRSMPPIDSIISAASALGKKGGSIKSDAKKKSSAENGKLGGRPKKTRTEKEG